MGNRVNTIILYILDFFSKAILHGWFTVEHFNINLDMDTLIKDECNLDLKGYVRSRSKTLMLKELL